ncbi:pimeloyl-ACP methyl ester esterase BioH [Pseudoalteromonas sp. MMG010]|uniref:pimeloyl-ACP methyl ester esterase BioH n=1 Tax=Pseudoalteromonas sp. MMG010 TaxID=2822685 RepID=UPI001B3A6AA5|nr:pimeloyl-ACP methyl ester esterase BioH [Pseudoalteromonas sp. MMG010]MBQ4834335.1 pimeloyl-ACP methyl ester esterase BioH [Pseudoalteromonas sp. MMG010]
MQSELILLHGWGMNQGIWQIIQPELESIYDGKVRALDLPGYGSSEFCPEPYDLHSAAHYISKQLKPNSTLMGWSLGGVFSLYIAKHWPDKVGKVILIASSPKFSEGASWPGIKPAVLTQFQQQLTKHREKTIERFLAIQAMGSETAKQDIKQIKTLLDQYPAPNEHALTAGLAILQNVDLRDVFSYSEQPIHGIFGRLDSLVPCKAISEMLIIKDGFYCEVIEKASHAPFISHKKEFISAVKSML